MGFKSLFKVRKPGHGQSFVDRVVSAIKTNRSRKFPSSDKTANSYGKKAI